MLIQNIFFFQNVFYGTKGESVNKFKSISGYSIEISNIFFFMYIRDLLT